MAWHKNCVKKKKIGHKNCVKKKKIVELLLTISIFSSTFSFSCSIFPCRLIFVFSDSFFSSSSSVLTRANSESCKIHITMFEKLYSVVQQCQTAIKVHDKQITVNQPAHRLDIQQVSGFLPNKDINNCSWNKIFEPHICHESDDDDRSWSRVSCLGSENLIHWTTETWDGNKLVFFLNFCMVCVLTSKHHWDLLENWIDFQSHLTCWIAITQ